MQTLSELEIELLAQTNQWKCAKNVIGEIFPNGINKNTNWQRELIERAAKMNFYWTNGFVVVDVEPSESNCTLGLLIALCHQLINSNKAIMNFVRIKFKSNVYMHVLRIIQEPVLQHPPDIGSHLLHTVRIFLTDLSDMDQAEAIEVAQRELARVCVSDFVEKWYGFLLQRIDAICKKIDAFYVPALSKCTDYRSFMECLDAAVASDPSLAVHKRLIQNAKKAGKNSVWALVTDANHLHWSALAKAIANSVFNGIFKGEVTCTIYHTQT